MRQRGRDPYRPARFLHALGVPHAVVITHAAYARRIMTTECALGSPPDPRPGQTPRPRARIPAELSPAREAEFGFFGVCRADAACAAPRWGFFSPSAHCAACEGARLTRRHPFVSLHGNRPRAAEAYALESFTQGARPAEGRVGRWDRGLGFQDLTLSQRERSLLVVPRSGRVPAEKSDALNGGTDTRRREAHRLPKSCGVCIGAVR